MKFRNDSSDNLVVEALRTFEWKAFEPRSEVDTPLTHDIVRSDLLCLRVMRYAPSNHVVSVSIPIDRREL